MHNILVGLEVVLGLALMVVIYLQPSKSDALSGLIQGSSNDTFFAKNKGRTKEALLVRMTVIFSILFAVNTVVLNLV